jgi:hypothetical protein
MKILVFKLGILRNDAHSQFMYTFDNLLKAFPAAMAVVAALYIEFIRLFAIEESLVDSAKGSDITRLLTEADQRIDRTVVGINSTVNAGLHHFDSKMVDAAHRIQVRMNAFGNIESKAYEEEANSVRLLVTDLRNNYSADLFTLSLGQWIDELALAGAAFDTLFTRRNTEWADRPDAKLKDIRKEIDAVYRPMTERINAAALMDEAGQYDEFIRQLNREIEYFVDHSHRHARKDVAHVTAAGIADQPFTGKAITPIPQVFFTEDGKPTVELVFAKDFTVTYRDNIKVGTATIIIHGKGAYRGTKAITFNIASPSKN